jgi:hypothetical protein
MRPSSNVCLRDYVLLGCAFRLLSCWIAYSTGGSWWILPDLRVRVPHAPCPVHTYVKGGSSCITALANHHFSTDSSDANRKNRLMTAMDIPAPPGPHQRPTADSDGWGVKPQAVMHSVDNQHYKNPLNSIYTSKQASNTINHKP